MKLKYIDLRVSKLKCAILFAYKKWHDRHGHRLIIYKIPLMIIFAGQAIFTSTLAAKASIHYSVCGDNFRQHAISM